MDASLFIFNIPYARACMDAQKITILSHGIRWLTDMGIYLNPLDIHLVLFFFFIISFSSSHLFFLFSHLSHFTFLISTFQKKKEISISELISY